MLSLISSVVCGSLNGPTLGHFVVHYVFFGKNSICWLSGFCHYAKEFFDKFSIKSSVRLQTGLAKNSFEHINITQIGL